LTPVFPIHGGYDLESATITQESQKERPWIRFWARHFDVLVHSMVIGLIWQYVHEASFEWISSWVTILMVFLWMFIEWGYMAAFGTTPGKKLMGIQVQMADGGAISRDIAFKRASIVWLKGMGLGISLITIVCNMMGYHDLRNAQTTTWDRDLKLTVIHKKVGFFRLLIGPLIVVAIYVIAIVGEIAY